MKFDWKMRVGLVLSAVWLCLVFLVADDYRRMTQFMGFGLLPLLVIWGIVWAVAGWLAQRPAQPATPEEAVLEARRKRSLRIRTTIAVIAVIGIGLFAATWQFHYADNEAGGNVIAQWFGEWLVYGLFAYVVFLLIPRTPPGFAIILASLVIVGGVNYKTYSTIALDRQAYDSMAKAAPLLNKMQSGASVSDQEVKDAKVGMMEPLMLAQAAYSRDVDAIAVAYSKAISALEPELMLTPNSLASPNIRAQTRNKLKIWHTATADYQTALQGATARGKLGIQAAQSQMPAVLAESALKGYDELSDQLNTYVNSLVASEKANSSTVTAILDLMDANSGGYVVDKGPPMNLIFRDEAVLAQYRRLVAEVMAGSQRDSDALSRLVKAQTDRTDKLTELLKR
jgi:hypothetical protein